MYISILGQNPESKRLLNSKPNTQKTDRLDDIAISRLIHLFLLQVDELVLCILMFSIIITVAFDAQPHTGFPAIWILGT